MKLLATALLALLAVAVAQDQPTLGDCRDIKLVDGGYTVEAKCGDGDDTTKLDLKPCILINNGLMMWDHFDKGGGFHKVCKDCKIVSQDDLHNKDKTITSLECDCKQHDGTTRKSKTNMSGRVSLKDGKLECAAYMLDAVRPAT